MIDEEVLRQLSSFEERQFSGGVPDDTIQRASEEIGLPFSPQYRAFLGELGSGHVSSEEFIGLGGPRHLDVAWLTRELRNRQSSTRFPITLIPIRSDGFGNYDCIDTSRPMGNGEFQIVEWQHDAGNDQVCGALADSYFNWFLGMLKDIRSLDSEEPRG
jgi:antitoxin YobK